MKKTKPIKNQKVIYKPQEEMIFTGCGTTTRILATMQISEANIRFHGPEVFLLECLV
jgi:ABC-type enterochelin transport system substrate-binding protein